MNINKLIFATLLFAGISESVNASVIQFTNHYVSGISNPNTSFADGTFSQNLGPQHDGFEGITNTSAFNGYGQNGEYIQFNAPVTLDSLQIRDCLTCAVTTNSVTVSLFNYYDLITSQTIDPNSAYQTLIFNADGVTKVEFDFTATTNNWYGDGRTAAWYDVNNITYTSPVPLPATAWLYITSLAAVASTTSKRKAS